MSLLSDVGAIFVDLNLLTPNGHFLDCAAIVVSVRHVCLQIFSVCSGVKQLDQTRTRVRARLRWNVLFGCNTVTTTTVAAAAATTTKTTIIAIRKRRFALFQTVQP